MRRHLEATSKAAGSASTLAPATARSRLSSMVKWSTPRKWSGTRERPPTPAITSTRSMPALKSAAARMPRVDAIGGSAAGIYIDNRPRVASLFRGIPKDLFDTKTANLFADLRKEWGGVPFDVVNDGEVTALAGAMSLNDGAVLGIAMGSSEAGGYVTPDGKITTWLNELAFCPVDVSPDAPVDEWSGDRGCGAQYFSQQAVFRLAAEAGIEIDPALGLAERLKWVQSLLRAGNPRAKSIWDTIGIYTGYGIAHYADVLRPAARADPGPGDIRRWRNDHHRQGE